jgi:NADPH-dependent 2,4-dienoyl-CoA reductase/sulfur reductase-like enzyme/rhodanese-related sulfurtransferase/TusA-related sulfurtransferase
MSKYVIIGGGAGGASTSARLRRLDEKSSIMMFEKGEYVSCANCGLPYYLGGEIRLRDRLFVKIPQDFFDRFDIDLRIFSEVIAIDRKQKFIKVKNLVSGEVYQENYDKLVVSPGAEAFAPNLKGIDNKGIFTLRTVPDTDEIERYIIERNPKKALIIGAGFIGMEMAENFHQKGIDVTILARSNQLLKALDYEMAAIVHQHLKTENVEFYTGEKTSEIIKNGNSFVVELESGKRIDTDMIIISAGVKPDNKLAKDAGLEIGKFGGITVNSYMNTSDKDIYAVGDAVETKNLITGKDALCSLAGPANKQGRIAATNIVSGNKRKYTGSLSTGIAKVFDLTVASTGESEKMLKKENIPYLSILDHPNHRVGYYPYPMTMAVKLLFSPVDGKLLGGQVVGCTGVDKRIDIISTMIRMEGTVYDLGEIEQAYAPPFSAAKDPVNMLGFIGDNMLNEQIKFVQWHEVKKLQDEGCLLLDVRFPEESKLGTIDGSVNIPLDELRKRIVEVPKGKKIVVFCEAGLRAYIAARMLMQNGYNDVYDLAGGYMTYEHAVQDPFFGNGYKSKRIKTSLEGGREKTVIKDVSAMNEGEIMLSLKDEMAKLMDGDMLYFLSDNDVVIDVVKKYAGITGHKFVDMEKIEGKTVAGIEKVYFDSYPDKKEKDLNESILCFA